MDNFSINSVDIPTKEDINVIFTPDSITTRYVYRIYQDGKLIDVVKVESNSPSTICLSSTGTLQIKVKATDQIGRETEYISGYYKIDKEGPTLNVGSHFLDLSVGDTLDVLGGVKATDNFDGDITNKVTSNISSLDLSKEGKQELIYSISDRAGNVTSKTVVLNITQKDNTGLIMVQSFIIVLLLAIIMLILRFRKQLRLEKRYGKYSIMPRMDESPSLIENIASFYKKIVSKLAVKLKKSVFITNYAKKLDKYLLFTKDIYQNNLELVSAKIIVGTVFVIIAIISKAVQYEILTLSELLIPFIIGFFTLDFVYMIQYKFYYDKMENDLLQAIIIMNNAFKSGRSIVQAIHLVGSEMGGIIGNQFLKMEKELSTGLNIEEVFSRFASRIDMEEVTYLTASLTILNKTGGNIIKVFTSIEKSLFLKKRLKLELKSLTGSSKIIMWVLFLVPILFVAVISLISPGYFNPLFESGPGIILFTVIVVLYIIYIFIVKNVLKVRM